MTFGVALGPGFLRAFALFSTFLLSRTLRGFAFSVSFGTFPLVFATGLSLMRLTFTASRLDGCNGIRGARSGG